MPLFYIDIVELIVVSNNKVVVVYNYGTFRSLAVAAIIIVREFRSCSQ